MALLVEAARGFGLRKCRSQYTAAVPPVVIENPILNSPFAEPTRHFRFSDDGITDEVADGRRESGYFLPIASPRKKSGQMKFETEWTQDRFLSSPRINRIRDRVKQWRQGGYLGVTRTTARLLDYWNDPGARAKAVLLPARGARDGHLPHRGGQPASATPGSRTSCARRTPTSTAGFRAWR